MIEALGHAGIDSGTTVKLDVSARAALVGLWGPEGVIGDYEVEQAIVVVVEPGSAYAERVRGFVVDAGLLGHVSKSAIAVVVVKRVLAGVGDEKVGAAVIIVIAGGDAEAEAEFDPREAGFFGDIIERAVASVSKQAVIKRRVSFLQFRKLGTVGEKEVHEAVAIVVEHRDPAAHRLWKVFPAGKIVVGAIGELRARGDVGELPAARDRACRGARHEHEGSRNQTHGK